MLSFSDVCLIFLVIDLSCFMIARTCFDFGLFIIIEMGEVEAKVVVPESVLKKRKRNEEWALAKKQELDAAKKKKAENRKLIFNRAKLYAKEYAEQVFIVGFSKVCFIFQCILVNNAVLIIQEKELIQLKREAKLKGGFYVDPEAKLLFIIRIRGYVSIIYANDCFLIKNLGS